MGRIKRWWNHVPEGYVTHNGFWVIAILILTCPIWAIGGPALIGHLLGWW